MNEKLEDIKDAINLQRGRAKMFYDQAEGISAKIKLFLALNKRTVVILVATHFVTLMIGVGLAK